MGRGLDGFFDPRSLAGCAVLKARAMRAAPPASGRRAPSGLDKFPVAIARGKYLFPFRTEQSSPAAPMVLDLQGSGRVGRRRSFTGGAAR